MIKTFGAVTRIATKVNLRDQVITRILSVCSLLKVYEGRSNFIYSTFEKYFGLHLM